TNTEKQLSEATINTFRDVFFPLSIHYRVNNNPILFEALSNPYPNMSSTDKKDIKTERELFLDTFKEQFGGDILWLATNILSEEQWKKLLIGEICNITEHLKNAAPSDSKDESWKEILQIYQLTDEQFAEVLAREIRKIENGLYKKVGILKHFIHIFQFIENKKILQSTSEYVQKVIATIDNIDYLELKNSEEYDSSHGGYGGYTYITSDNCGLEKRSYIADFMKHINTRKLHLEQQILRDNSENFPFNSIVYTTELLGPEAKRQLDNKIDYHRLPILKYIKPLDFQNMLSTSNSRDISSLLKVCKDRATFSKIHRLSIMKEKLNFWNELLLLVRKHLETNLTALRLGFVFAEQSITSLINTLEEIDTDYPN
ncbi:hypothetical protein, partial [Shewanella sp. TC10]|uniref:hypothetical protein n=1 Tax=Shewanella sp. TC10 TaxID=1419739 RepID=UPI0018928F61